MSGIKRLTKADYREILALNQYAFQYTRTEEENEQYGDKIKSHTIFGWMEGDELAAKVHIIPFQVYLGDSVLDMGGIAAVASWPEQRRGGKVKQLLQKALYTMREEGKTLSYLHPFSVPFYRKYGWELAFDQLECTIPIQHFLKDWNGKGKMIRRKKSKQTVSLLQQIYKDYAQHFTGMLDRTSDWWDHKLDERDQIILAQQQGSSEGYLVYQVADHTFTIKDAAFSTLNGRKQILQFIRNHDSMVETVKWTLPADDPLSLLVEEPSFEQKLAPYFMARIVDVKGFLEQYPYSSTVSSNQSFIIEVEDDFLVENTGSYQITHKQSQLVIHPEKDPSLPRVKMNIQQLTQIFLGYKRPQELAAVLLVEGDPAAVELLEEMIPHRQTYLPDFF
ncbi:GNAT family N-acetyltransferase [Gracilibacillus timonensis]|uniref:GNAT family N-acetyltransferase n=1 Tax=Gracilibacillus timonensis TaxID=1816696 RepID=UPI0008243EF5|nr:GNAT family N-acetyltransferase [Gracilibacillus timonensis]